MSDTFTVAELAEACTGGNVMAMAKMLNDVGAQLTAQVGDPMDLATTGRQVVNRAVVSDLAAMREGDRVGRKLAQVLRQG